jgi:hypothetical protein
MAHEQEVAKVVERYLRPVLDALSDRDAKNASRTAGRLTFWRDGMLGDLKKIAAGKHDETTIASLKKQFEELAPRVKEAIAELHKLRGRLARKGETDPRSNNPALALEVELFPGQACSGFLMPMRPESVPRFATIRR